MDEQALYDREKLIQQLQGEQPVQTEQHEHSVHNVYGAEREALERAAAAGLEASKRAAAATTASEQGRSSILKGLAAGADIYALFSLACDTISKTTGDTTFSDQAAEYIRTVYGRALGEVSPLRAELAAVQDRAGRIKAYMELPDISAADREAARRAYLAHEKAADAIRAQIDK